MAIQLYNLEGQPMEQIPDGSPIPPGRWNTPQGGFNSRNGGWGLGAGTINPSTGQALAQGAPGDALHAGLPQNNPTNNAGFSSLITGQQGGGGAAAAGGAKPSYNDLLAKFKAANPNDGGPGSEGDFGARFNAWVGQSGLAPNGWVDSPAGPNAYTPGGGTSATTVTPPNITPGPGQNYAQGQTGNQTGTFNTSGNTTTNQGVTSGSNTSTNQSGTQTGTQNTTNTGTNTQNTTTGQQGTTTGTTAGNVDTTGTATTRPIDTLGFGGLLQGAAAGTQASDAARTGFLQDVMNTGGTQFGSQVDQAVRQAVSGPGLTGSGDSARARAAGYAGAQVARNNLDQRLGAAGQLAGPTGLTTLSGAANPYIGQSTATTGTQASTGTTGGTSNVTGTQNTSGTNTNTGTTNTSGATTNTGNTATSGWQNLLSNVLENQSGTAAGTSASSAAGQIPSSNQVSTGGGGCVLCTAGVHHGIFRNLRLLRRVISYKLSSRRFSAASRGYFFLFTPVARRMLTSRRLAVSLLPLARAVVYEEARVAGVKLPFHLWPWVVHWSGHLLCKTVGNLPVPAHVRSHEIEAVARKHNIWFPLP